VQVGQRSCHNHIDPAQKMSLRNAIIEAELVEQLGLVPFDPELMTRMLIVGYCYGIRSERRLTQEVELHLAYRWFCKLDLEDEGQRRRSEVGKGTSYRA
jgi:transposase